MNIRKDSCFVASLSLGSSGRKLLLSIIITTQLVQPTFVTVQAHYLTLRSR